MNKSNGQSYGQAVFGLFVKKTYLTNRALTRISAHVYRGFVL
jgi:hypothetical protein